MTIPLILFFIITLHHPNSDLLLWKLALFVQLSSDGHQLIVGKVAAGFLHHLMGVWQAGQAAQSSLAQLILLGSCASWEYYDDDNNDNDREKNVIKKKVVAGGRTHF